MNLTVNSISSVDRSYNISEQKNNSSKKDVSFEGLKISSKQVKGAAVGFALFAASVLGLSACKSDKSEKAKEVNSSEYVIPAESVDDEQEVLSDKYFEEMINDYMAKDKKVVRVEIDFEASDPAVVNHVRMINACGYDKNDKIIRVAKIYPHGSYDYYPGDYSWIEILPDKRITVNSNPKVDPKEDEIIIRTEYTKPSKFEGKPGYYKTETVNKGPNIGEGEIAKTEVYEKGKPLSERDGNCAYPKDYCRCIINYDKTGKLLEKIYLYPDKEYYSSLQIDKKKSILK